MLQSPLSPLKKLSRDANAVSRGVCRKLRPAAHDPPLCSGLAKQRHRDVFSATSSCRREDERGRYNGIAPRDPLFAGMVSAAMPALPGIPQGLSNRSIASLTEKYLDLKRPEWAPKTRLDNKTVLNLFGEVVGFSRPVDAEHRSPRGRYPFSEKQLRKLFSSPVYTGCKSASRRSAKGQHVIRDGKFWIPLIALYSSMRLGEIVQLLVGDIKSEHGVAYFDICRGEGEKKQIKTASSMRRVPIHKMLN